jgi:hypothetical protein
MIRRVIVIATLCLSACGGNDADSWVDRQHTEDIASFGDDPDFLLQRGLRANRKYRYVDVLAHATGIGAGSKADLVLAGRDSKSAGAIAVAEVNAAELQGALTFIGLSAGHPIDIDKLLYWPKGNRVTISVYWDQDGDGRLNEVVEAERLLVDNKWDSELPKLGFRYVGPMPGVQSAIELASAYNSQNTLFEVAYTISNKYAEEHFSVNPAYVFATGQALRVRLRPEAPGVRVEDYLLEVANGDGDDGGRIDNLRIHLRVLDSEELVVGGFEDVFLSLEKKIAEGEEPFIRIHFSDAMSAASVRDVARFTGQFLVEQQIRIEPSEADPYFSAFLPNETWREPNRRGRSTQPLEIHFADGEFAGELFQHSENTVRHSFNNASELAEVLKAGGPWETDGVFVFVTPDTPYVQIRNVFELVGQQFGNFYVFL